MSTTEATVSPKKLWAVRIVAVVMVGQYLLQPNVSIFGTPYRTFGAVLAAVVVYVGAIRYLSPDESESA